jgi:hypothetical protein
MPQVSMSAALGRPSKHSKRIIADEMQRRGESFLVASACLNRAQGSPLAIRHLICQGMELYLKGLLLEADFDRYQPRLPGKNRRRPDGIGHDLEKLLGVCVAEFGVRPPRPVILEQLRTLNRLYTQHLLRYASTYDVLFAGHEPECRAFSRWLCSVVRLCERVRRHQRGGI